MNNKTNRFWAVFAALVVFVGLTIGPAAAWTGVQPTSTSNASPRVFQLESALRIANDTNTRSFDVTNAQLADWHVTVAATESTTPFTVTLQTSCDNANWVDGPSTTGVATTLATTEMSRTSVLCSRARYKIDTTNATPFTLTVWIKTS